MNCINGWNYIHGWNILLKQNPPHACNHTYGGIYTSEWISNSWIKIHNFIHTVALLLMRFTLSYFYNGIPLIYVINFIHTCHVASLCFDFIHVMKFNHIFWCIHVVQFSSKWSISFMLSNSSLWSYFIHTSIINISFHINSIHVKI